MSEVRHYDSKDARRDALVEAFKHHVHAAKLDADYDADIEYMGEALVAFVDEQLQVVVKALRYCADYRNREAASRIAQDSLVTLDAVLNCPGQ